MRIHGLIISVAVFGAVIAAVPATAQRGSVAATSLGDGAFRDGEPVLSREDYRTATQYNAAEQEALMEMLHRRISVRLTGVTVREAAEVLSRVCGFRVRVDGAVTTGRRVTIEAEYIPVGVIAEEIASQTGLVIAPEMTGIGFRQVPFMAARSRRSMYGGPLAPWNDDWSRRPIGTHLMDTDALVGPLSIPGNSDVVRIPAYVPLTSPP